MNIRNHFPTEELQKRDAAHHLHPFTAQHDLANKGSESSHLRRGLCLR